VLLLWRAPGAVDREDNGLDAGVRKRLLQEGQDRFRGCPLIGADRAFDPYHPDDAPERAPAKAGGAEEEQEVPDSEQHGEAKDHCLENHLPSTLGLSLGGGKALGGVEGLTLSPELAQQFEEDVRLGHVGAKVCGLWVRSWLNG
jgi:hypothetical protein